METTELEGRKRLGLGPHLGSLSEMGGGLSRRWGSRGPTRTPTEGPGGLPLTSSFHTHLYVKYDNGCTARPNRPDQEIPGPPPPGPRFPFESGNGDSLFPARSRFRRIGKRGAPVSRKKTGNRGNPSREPRPLLTRNILSRVTSIMPWAPVPSQAACGSYSGSETVTVRETRNMLL